MATSCAVASNMPSKIGLAGFGSVPVKVAAMACSVSSTSGSHGASEVVGQQTLSMEAARRSTSSCTSSEDEHGLGERTWDYVEVENPGELVETLRREHWVRSSCGMKTVGAVEGGIHGQWLKYLESEVPSMEEELVMVEGFHQETIDSKLASLAATADGDEAEPVSTTAQSRAVLQTYTVSLAEVKRDIDLWKEPLEAELEALVQSGTIRRVKADQVPQKPGYDYMTVAPAKIVPTIKAPVGKEDPHSGVCVCVWKSCPTRRSCQTG